MAFRGAIQNINQENDNSRMNAKSHISAGLVKRPALNELSNRPQAIQKSQNLIAKQNVCMLPPENVAKKLGSLLPPKKEPSKSTLQTSTVVDPKKPLKRQESILKSLPQNVAAPKENSRNISNLPASNLSRKQSITNPDEDIKYDAQMVPEYLMDIFKYLREMEDKLAISSNFLENHESTPKMRAILVNWLVEVHANFRFTLDTLHICIGIIDRYLQANPRVGKNTLQLVGTSALFLACKYEEVHIPELEDFEYICDNTFSKRQILQMEIDIFRTLNFSLGRPISVQFLRRYTKLAQGRNEHHNLGKYILELVLIDDKLSQVKPSLQAAAACCLSFGILNETMNLQKLWTPTLVHYTTYSYNDFRSMMAEFACLIVKNEKSRYDAIRKKYAAPKYGKISLNSKLDGPLVRKLTVTKK